MTSTFRNALALTFVASIVASLLPGPVFAQAPAPLRDRVKDIVSIGGVRSNQLIGYGIVVGLNGTGDGNVAATSQTMQSLMQRFGLTVDAAAINAKNTAAVMVTAELPAFAKPGQKIDVTVSSIGKAGSLRGGSLLVTQLVGSDNETYAIAQGNLAVGGLGITAKDGSSVTVNIPTVGRIPGGASVERIVSNPFESAPSLMLNLNSPDFSNSTQLARVINTAFGAGTALALDGATVNLNAPREPDRRVSFLAAVEELTITPAAPPARDSNPLWNVCRKHRKPAAIYRRLPFTENWLPNASARGADGDLSDSDAFVGVNRHSQRSC